MIVYVIVREHLMGSTERVHDLSVWALKCYSPLYNKFAEFKVYLFIVPFKNR